MVWIATTPWRSGKLLEAAEQPST